MSNFTVASTECLRGNLLLFQGSLAYSTCLENNTVPATHSFPHPCLKYSMRSTLACRSKSFFESSQEKPFNSSLVLKTFRKLPKTSQRVLTQSHLKRKQDHCLLSSLTDAGFFYQCVFRKVSVDARL